MLNNKEKTFISAVVYLHNNQDEIIPFLNTLHAVLSANFQKIEIICVNDASDDDTVKNIKACNLASGVLSIIHMSYYQGLELSMNAGVDLAIGDFVYEFDSCYMDYTEETITDLYKKSLTGYDIVIASSKSKQRSSSKWFYRLFNSNAKMQYKLTTESFRILSRRAINRIHSISKTIPYRKAVYANCGLNASILKYDSVMDASQKPSKIQKGHRKSTAIDTLILFTDVASKFTFIMTFLMMFSTVASAVYAFIVFLNGSSVAGWTTTMLFLSFAFFGVFAILSIIIKYLSLLIDLVFKKQQYLIENIEKITN